MKKTRYIGEQIAFALKQAETGTRMKEISRKMGISEATVYNWKKKQVNHAKFDMLLQNKAYYFTY